MSIRKYQPPNLPRSTAESLINEWVRGERRRQLIKKFYYDELTVEALAEEYGLSVSTIKRDLQEADKQLFAHLQREKSADTELNNSNN